MLLRRFRSSVSASGLGLASMGREDAEASFLRAFRTSIRSPTALTVFLMGVSAS
jgi:hypothetical protein